MIGVFQVFIFNTVLLVINSYLNRYGSIWTKFQLEPSILEPNGDLYVNGAHGLLGWGTTRRHLKVSSGIAPRSRYVKELKVLCREFRSSSTSQQGVIMIMLMRYTNSHQISRGTIYIYIYIYIERERAVGCEALVSSRRKP